MKNYLFFTLKMGLVVGLMAAVCMSFRQVLVISRAVPFAEYWPWVADATLWGLASGLVGFWLIYPSRNRSPEIVKSSALLIGSTLAGTVLLLTRSVWGTSSTMEIILYPLLPAFVGVVAFGRLAKMHFHGEI